MPSAQFQHSVALNLRYWLEKTADVDDSIIHNLDKEHHNILRAVQFGLELEETRLEAVQLILNIFMLIERRGYWRQWIPPMVSVLSRMDASLESLRLSMLDVLGQCYRLDRRWEEAISAHKEVEALARSLGDERALAKAHLHLSQDYWNVRNYHECENYGETALGELLRFSEPDLELVGAATTILGLSHYGRGDHVQAEEKLLKAVEIYRESGQAALLGRSLMNLALTLEALGKGDEALASYEEAQTVLEPTEHDLDKLRVELSLGTLHINAGRLREAEDAFQRADSAFLRRSGLIYYQALTANNLGNTYLEMGRLDEAERYLRQSIDLWEIAGGALMLANTMGTLAEVLVLNGDLDTAIPLYQKAIQITANYPEDAWGRRLNRKFEKSVAELPRITAVS